MAGLMAEVEQMLGLVDQKGCQMVDETTGQLLDLRRQVEYLAEGVQAMRAAREIEYEQILRGERNCEARANLSLNGLAEARLDSEAKLEELWSYQLGELQELQHGYDTSIGSDATLRLLDEEIRNFTSAIEAQRHARQEAGERLVCELEADFKKVHDSICAQQRLRFQAEATTMRMVEDVRSQMQQMLQHERAQREAVQGKLLTLLEEACSRIEHTIVPKSPSALGGSSSSATLHRSGSPLGA